MAPAPRRSRRAGRGRPSPAGCRRARAPAGRRRPSRLRSAQRIERRMLAAATAPSAGCGVHSSKAITMSEPSSRWIAIERSGVSMWRLPSMWLGSARPPRSACAGREAHHLEAARVGQDRPVPVHEPVQAAEASPPARRRGAASGGRCCRAGCRRRSRARSRAASPSRGRGADRHEGRRADVAARRPDHPGAGPAVRAAISNSNRMPAPVASRRDLLYLLSGKPRQDRDMTREPDAPLEGEPLIKPSTVDHPLYDRWSRRAARCTTPRSR
jgi:hypothetical protein